VRNPSFAINANQPAKAAADAAESATFFFSPSARYQEALVASQDSRRREPSRKCRGQSAPVPKRLRGSLQFASRREAAATWLSFIEIFATDNGTKAPGRHCPRRILGSRSLPGWRLRTTFDGPPCSSGMHQRCRGQPQWMDIACRSPSCTSGLRIHRHAFPQLAETSHDVGACLQASCRTKQVVCSGLT
jgi:hypothetical protein